ncbi:hypothetical protein [Sphingomonas sp.]|uniref:hypothetical protein n=1 Tax=Sphingomonas sp. TaxID=28214 RepID=UPI003B3AC9DE
MATLPIFVDPDAPESDDTPRPMLTLVHDADSYDVIERTAPGVASRGVHSGALIALVALYAMLLTSFWTFFARDTSAALVMTMVTVLMIIYFGLMIGGILVADAAMPGELRRNFADFLNGPVETFNDVITGRQAVVQMLFLPACMVMLATTIGIVARTAHSG